MLSADFTAKFNFHQEITREVRNLTKIFTLKSFYVRNHFVLEGIYRLSKFIAEENEVSLYLHLLRDQNFAR